MGTDRLRLTEDSAKDIPVFSESLLASAWFKFPEFFARVGYLLIHQPGTRKSWNSELKKYEVTRPDFQIIHPDKPLRVELEVTESRWKNVKPPTLNNWSPSESPKERQFRILSDCHERDPNLIPLLLSWEALTHPKWMLTLIRSVAEGLLGMEQAINVIDQSVHDNQYDPTKIPH